MSPAVGGAKEREALRELEERMGALEERINALERRIEERPTPAECSCADDLIGCLDNCVEDVKALRKRVKDVRSSERGP